MFETFFKRLEKLRTDAALENAFYNFATSHRRSGGTIKVQPTSRQRRRRAKLGGSAPITPGRPLKRGKPVEHQYSKTSMKKRKAPHGISYCSQHNLPGGR